MPDYGRHFEPLEPWIQKLKLDFVMDDIPDVYKKLMLRHDGKIVSMPYDGDVHIMFWNKVAFERPDNKKKFKASTATTCTPPKTWKQWDDQAEFFHGWGWDGTDRKLFGAGASYKPSATATPTHWWRPRFFSYGGQYFDADMKPLINGPAGAPGPRGDGADHAVLSARRPPLRVGGAEDHADQGRGPAAVLVDLHRQAGGRTRSESVIVGKAGFGIVPGAEIDGKIVHRPASRRAGPWPSPSTRRRTKRP